MEIADNPKMDLIGLQENMVTTTTTAQKISVVDHINGFQYSPERSDNFVINMEESYSNPRITLQRGFSRKGSFRAGAGSYGGSEKKVNSNGSVSKERESAATAASSPGAGPGVGGGGERGLLLGSSTPEKGTVEGQGHHQITITSAAGSIKATTAVEGRSPSRRNSFKRHQSSWLLDPRKVLFFFATLSSLGTLLLIYFTLSIASVQSDDAAALE
ncbi:unnamed protein product [Linum tenue]|uniref:Uncharacterized protein n=1 Tax=Linum tenue TaxID=586396 RepID=A0AAV0JB18_9ROSI|nr:unnamed protein product [Linum tenue]